MVTMKSLVSYNPELYNLMQHSQATDQRIKITQFPEKIDKFNEKLILTLGEQAKVEYSSKIVPFEKFQSALGKFNAIKLFHDITGTVCIGEKVNVVVYIYQNNSKTFDINTQYGMKKKKR